MCATFPDCRILSSLSPLWENSHNHKEESQLIPCKEERHSGIPSKDVPCSGDLVWCRFHHTTQKACSYHCNEEAHHSLSHKGKVDPELPLQLLYSQMNQLQFHVLSFTTKAHNSISHLWSFQSLVRCQLYQVSFSGMTQMQLHPPEAPPSVSDNP